MSQTLFEVAAIAIGLAALFALPFQGNKWARFALVYFLPSLALVWMAVWLLEGQP